jgi:hypothetical protein
MQAVTDDSQQLVDRAENTVDVVAVKKRNACNTQSMQAGSGLHLDMKFGNMAFSNMKLSNGFASLRSAEAGTCLNKRQRLLRGKKLLRSCSRGCTRRAAGNASMR